MHIHAHPEPGPTHHSLNRAFGIAVVMTLGYTIAEGMYAVLAHSVSLLADAGHNLGDVLGLILAWIANWLLSFPAKKRYSYGFKRMTILASLVNACLLAASSTIIVYESIHKLLNSTPTNEKIVMILATIGIIVNGGSSLLFRKGAHVDLNIRSAFWHLLADTLILAGVLFSALLIDYTKWYWIDPVVGLIIVGVVIWGTWGLLRDSVHLVLDAVPHHIDYAGVNDYLQNYTGVKAVHDLHIWGLSTREVALTAHLVMTRATLTEADHQTINTVLYHDFRINHVTIQLEWDYPDSFCQRRIQC